MKNINKYMTCDKRYAYEYLQSRLSIKKTKKIWQLRDPESCKVFFPPVERKIAMSARL